MNVSIRRSEELQIVDVEGHATILATLTDEAPGKGRLTVVEYGQQHTCYFNNMGDRTIREFLKVCDTSYVVGCLDPFGTLYRKIEPPVLVQQIVADLESSTRHNDDDKLHLLARMQEFSPISDVNGLQALCSNLMAEIYGPMWATEVNAKFLGKHSLYTGLSSRVDVIREALVQ